MFNFTGNQEIIHLYFLLFSGINQVAGVLKYPHIPAKRK